MFANGLRRLLMAFAAAATLGFASSAAAQTYDGDWAGVLKAGPQQLKLLLHVKTSGGETIAVLDIPDQGASLTSGAVMLKDGKINILFMQAMAEMYGGLSDDGKSLNLKWRQGLELPVTLTKVEVATPAATPAKP